MRFGNIKRVLSTRVHDDKAQMPFRGYSEHVLVSEPGPRPAPQAYLVHQQPGWVLPVHYHGQDQFQVVTGGSGTLGAHGVGAVSIHYASRESGYGPITAGPSGLDYLTLRACCTLDAFFLPESRPLMRIGLRKCQKMAGPLPTSSDEDLAGLGMSRVEELIAPDETGLGSWMLWIPPGQSALPPAQQNSGGRFYIVVAGSLSMNDEELGPPSCVWQSGDEAMVPMQGGSRGTQLLIVQYPASSIEVEPEMLPSSASA